MVQTNIQKQAYLNSLILNKTQGSAYPRVQRSFNNSIFQAPSCDSKANSSMETAAKIANTATILTALGTVASSIIPLFKKQQSTSPNVQGLSAQTDALSNSMKDFKQNGNYSDLKTEVAKAYTEIDAKKSKMDAIDVSDETCLGPANRVLEGASNKVTEQGAAVKAAEAELAQAKTDGKDTTEIEQKLNKAKADEKAAKAEKEEAQKGLEAAKKEQATKIQEKKDIQKGIAELEGKIAKAQELLNTVGEKVNETDVSDYKKAEAKKAQELKEKQELNALTQEEKELGLTSDPKAPVEDRKKAITARKDEIKTYKKEIKEQETIIDQNSNLLETLTDLTDAKKAIYQDNIDDANEKINQAKSKYQIN